MNRRRRPSVSPHLPVPERWRGRGSRSLILTGVVLVWGLPRFKDPVNAATTLKWPKSASLHNRVNSGRGDHRPSHAHTGRTEKPAVAEFAPVTATGSAVFVAAVLGGLILGLRPARLVADAGRDGGPPPPSDRGTIYRDASARFRDAEPRGWTWSWGWRSPGPGRRSTRSAGRLLGWLGVALTGSDTVEQRPVR